MQVNEASAGAERPSSILLPLQRVLSQCALELGPPLTGAVHHGGVHAAELCCSHCTMHACKQGSPACCCVHAVHRRRGMSGHMERLVQQQGWALRQAELLPRLHLLLHHRVRRGPPLLVGPHLPQVQQPRQVRATRQRLVRTCACPRRRRSAARASASARSAALLPRALLPQGSRGRRIPWLLLLALTAAVAAAV